MLYRRAPSFISGVGNFAVVDIKRGTSLGIGLVKKRNTGVPDNDYVRYDIARYTNHSNQPNLYYRRVGNRYEFIAKRNIRAGEELTIDYNTFDFEGERDFA
jgi:hypothetical protein